MDDQLLVDVVYPLADLLYYRRHHRLLHPVVLLCHLIELPARAELYQQVNVVGIIKVSVQWSDISVIQEELNRELPRNLILILLRTDLRLGHHLHTTQKSCLFVLHEHNLAELTLSHLPSN